MKRHHFNFLSFLFVLGLMVAAVLATYVAVTSGTGGFMTRAATPFDCRSLDKREVLCKTKNLCYWKPATATNGFAAKKAGTCESKLGASITNAQCNKVGSYCCTDSLRHGVCDAGLVCDPTKYTCVKPALFVKLGQERGSKGTCSVKFKGATCKWYSDCAAEGGNTDGTLGYCKGSNEWRCCKPK